MKIQKIKIKSSENLEKIVKNNFDRNQIPKISISYQGIEILKPSVINIKPLEKTPRQNNFHKLGKNKDLDLLLNDFK